MYRGCEDLGSVNTDHYVDVRVMENALVCVLDRREIAASRRMKQLLF